MKTACPRCGANVSFMPGTQKLYCEYCGSQIDVSEFLLDSYEESNVIENDINNEYYGESKSNYDEYTCSTCGAKLIADDTTTITDCAYCGSRQILKAKFQGDFNPVEIIPFKIDRNNFINIYTKFVKKKILAPEEFKNNPRLMETKGMYVPFHLFFFDVDTHARGEAIKKTNDNTSYKYFETDFSMKILAPEDSSKKLNDDVMTSLEPFNYKELTKFNPVYLNGFMSENGNENMEELERKAEARGINESMNQVYKKLEGYHFIKGKLHTNFKKLESRYVLLPVWFINTWYKDKLYTYAVNGQTGKVVGEIPLSKPKFTALMTVLCIVAVLLTLILLIAYADSDSDSDGLGELLACIWGGVVAAYVAIKKRYKNVNNVLENQIQSWDLKEKKYNKFSKGQYKKTFGDAELKTMDIQLFRNGVNVKELNNNQQSKARKKLG